MRGQVGIEFFLILGFCVTIITVLVSNSESQISENERLDNAVLSLSALNSVSNAVNSVFLQGNGASQRTTVFIPRTTKCFILTPDKKLSCDIGDADGRRTSGMQLYASPTTIASGCYSVYGWVEVKVTNTNSGIQLDCSGQS